MLAGLAFAAFIIFWVVFAILAARADAQSLPPRVDLTVKTSQNGGSIELGVNLRNNTRGSLAPVLEIMVTAGGKPQMPDVDWLSPRADHIYYRVDRPSVWWRLSPLTAGGKANQAITLQADARGDLCVTVRVRWKYSAGYPLAPPRSGCFRNSVAPL